MTNPFHATMAEVLEVQSRRDIMPPEPFYAKDHAAARQREKVMRMTRQELFMNGYIGVKDLDDEELREGRCRDANGRIPKRSSKTDLLPRDLYDAMIAEHLQRTNEKLRSQMDVALATMVDIMNDDTCEPKDRMEAAKYLYERVAGKTPDRVQVQVSKAPWEEVIQGIAQISRAESRALREGTIDAEVVEHDTPYAHDYVERGGDAGSGAAESPSGTPNTATDAAEPGEATRDVKHTPQPPTGDESVVVVEAKISPAAALGIHDAELLGDLRIQPATPVPGFDSPESTSATMPPTSNADFLRQKQEEAKALAARRKEARKKIQDAKKRRAIARAMGRDAVQDNNIEMTEADGKLKFTIE